MKKKILAPLLLIGMSIPLSLSTRFSGVRAEFIGEANDQTNYIAYASQIGAQLADEGFVLLKNDGYLPMKTKGAKITLAGKSAFSIARGGAGSGSGSINSGVKAFDLESSLTEVGASVNPTLKAFYADNNKSGQGRKNGNDGWKGNSQVQIGETPASAYGQDELNSFTAYNDLAIQVITREGSEGCDVKAIDARDYDPRSGANNSPFQDDAITDKHALELSDNELELFNLLKEHFEHIVIIINSSNIFECGVFEQDEKVSGVLWIGNPGDVGPGAVGRILSGQVNPSGHTVDTWAADFKKDPTYQNFSDNSQTSDRIFKTNDSTYFGKTDNYAAQDTMLNADGTPTHSLGTDKNYTLTGSPRWLDETGKVVQGGLNGVKPSAYVSYEEGIYSDYRYYETKYDDMLEAGEGADAWYDGDEGVVYPFGYGLSYTTFDQEIVSSNIKNKTLKNGNVDITVNVKVKNTGDVAGKEVVQLYWKAPYYYGEIEKASKVLCAFDKTDILEPGEEQTLELTFNSQDVANYDFSDANNNGFAGYELDGGDYQIILGKNAHEELDSIKFKVADGGVQYENDRFTGHKVENRFTDRGFYNCLPGEDDFEFTQFSRTDFDETFPTHPTFKDRTLGANSRMEEFLTHEFTLKEIEDKNFDYVPEAVYKTADDIPANWSQAETTSSVPVTIKFTDMINSDIDDPRWDEFMNQLTYNELLEFVYGPNTHNMAISRLDKPSTGDSDGPQRFRIMWWVSGPIVAATYNVDLAHKQGDCYGMEAHLSSNTYGWAGPGVNIHRSPFGGRNFEYYSADPFLTGRISGRVIAGASDKGVYCYFKHFVVNDQEKNREGTSTFLTEQALREIYLKTFQMDVQEGKAFGLMSSYNRLGNMETAASYPLLTEVLREEWGFKGAIISDMTHSGNSSVNFKCYENINNRVLAGCNQQLDNGGGFKDNIDAKWDSTLGCPVLKSDNTPTYTWWYAVRTMAQQGIWACAHSGVNSKTLIGNAYDVELTNVTRSVYYGEVGQDVEIEVILPDELSDYEVSIDPYTPLPEGLEFDGYTISGVSDEPVNKFIHLIFDNGTQKLGLSFELRIYAVANDGELIGGKKGCFGAFEMSMMSMLLLGATSMIILLIDKKRKNLD